MPGLHPKIGETIVKWAFLRLPLPLVLVLVAISMPVLVGWMYLDDPPVFDISLTSFTVPTHQQALLSDGAYAAKSNCTGTACINHHCPGGRRQRRALNGGGGSAHSRQRRAPGGGGSFKISVVYHALHSGNVVSPEAVRDIHGIERSMAIQATSRGASVSINSLTMFFYPRDSPYVEPAALLTEAEVTAALDYASGSTNTAGNPAALGAVLYDFTSGFDRTGGGIWSGEHIRSEVTVQESASDEALQVRHFLARFAQFQLYRAGCVWAYVGAGRCLLLSSLKIGRYGADLTFLRPFFVSRPGLTCWMPSRQTTST